MLAIKVDALRGVVWATEVALRGFSAASESDWGRSAVLCYGLKNGRLLRRIEGPRPSGLGDMVVASSGDVIVSDGDGGGVYRVRADGSGGLERLDGGDFISPQTPAMHPDGKHIFVPDYLRGIRGARSCNEAGALACDGREICSQWHRRTVFRSWKIDRCSEWDLPGARCGLYSGRVACENRVRDGYRAVERARSAIRPTE